MIKINDAKLLKKYISEHSISDIFTEDNISFMEILFFKRNEYICKDSEPLEYFLIFVEGRAKAYIPLSNGKALLLCFYEGFQVIGDLEVIKGKNASSNIQAVENTICIGIPLEYVRTNLLNDPKFLKFICSSLGDKLIKLSKNSSINLLYPLESRLASYILAAGERKDKCGKIVIEISENLTEISELLGTSYRHLHRTLNIFCAKGIIKKNNKAYEVVDESDLVRLAADLYR